MMRATASELAPEGLLQHSQRERIQGGGGLCMVALEGVEPYISLFSRSLKLSA